MEEKQLVTHRQTLYQKTFIGSRTAGGGDHKAVPYKGIGSSRDLASLWHRKGGRPIPGGDRRFIVAKAALASEYRLEKWGRGSKVGVKRKPNHLSTGLGGKVIPLRWTGRVEGGLFSHVSRQWINSVLGIERDMLRGEAFLSRQVNACWRRQTFVL